jgi:DNA primase
MDYIDTKYIQLVSASLENFKNKGTGVYNFRCPYCGDSKTNKLKARGYIFDKDAKPIFKCHNCGHGASLNNFLKHVNPQLQKEYALEKFGREKGVRTPSVQTQPTLRFQKRPEYLKTPLGKLKKVSQLDPEHPVRQYVSNRGIPKRVHYKLFYAPKFYEFARLFQPDKFKDTENDEPRLIIPFINRNKQLVAFQGRSFSKTGLRYITVKIDENAPKIFGLDSLDPSKTVYIVEGPIDSMFLENCVAMAGADLTAEALRSLGTSDCVFVFDNEPRNKEIVKRIEKTIDLGYSIALFPDYVKEKDINDMVLAGRDPDEVQMIISSNTFKGLAAKAKLSEWRKV